MTVPPPKTITSSLYVNDTTILDLIGRGGWIIAGSRFTRSLTMVRITTLFFKDKAKEAILGFQRRVPSSPRVPSPPLPFPHLTIKGNEAEKNESYQFLQPSHLGEPLLGLKGGRGLVGSPLIRGSNDGSLATASREESAETLISSGLLVRNNRPQPPPHERRSRKHPEEPARLTSC